jgi:hypothetical protein
MRFLHLLVALVTTWIIIILTVYGGYNIYLVLDKENYLPPKKVTSEIRCEWHQYNETHNFPCTLVSDDIARIDL